ncbi:macro domain-containing protein [Micromonospora sp. CPCC 206060]|uniref:macro domain-containing protein n=1 Tax=Micromonospora sp. CPCC 206060 TaxID=3122406 RepID=UPI002FF04E61
MPHVRVAALGQLLVEVDGKPARLTPTNARMLLRLLVAGGRPVAIEQLYRDIWHAGTAAPLSRGNRTLVQRQIGELRRIVDPERPGDTSKVILTARGTSSAYRLALARDDVDVWRFEDLAEATRTVEPAHVPELARTALALWRDTTAVQLGPDRSGVRELRRLLALRASVQRRLLDAYVELRRPDEARSLARELLAEQPTDSEVRAILDDLRQRESTDQHVVLRHTFDRPRATLLLAVGDLFALHRADLVVGFTDTFDTSTQGDRVISATSIQGQLLHRVYQGDRERLDRDLRRALSGVPEAGRETRSSKRHGKLVRYPVGTVAVLPDEARRIFCVAYSRLGNDLVAQSSLEWLTDSLDRVWEALHRHGQFADVAIPLVGSGRSRLDTVDHQGLLELIVRSFIRASGRIPICRELRIVLSPHQREKVDIDALHRLINSL